jgi:hypothetical protein
MTLGFPALSHPSRRAIVLAIFVLATGSVLRGEEVAVGAVEDSWIANLGGTTTHGADPSLRVCPACYQWTYLKFDLSGVTGEIASAELRLVRTSGERPDEISLYRIADDTWSEATLTGPSRPAPQTPENETSLARGVAESDHDRWSSAAVLQVVRAERDGDGTLSLMVREDYNSTYDPRTYHSREGAPSLDLAPRLVLGLEGSSPRFGRGDANADGSVDVADPVFILLYLFAGGSPPSCGDAADADDDGTVALTDAIALLGHLFKGDAPPGPSPGVCSSDATEDELPCHVSRPCP